MPVVMQQSMTAGQDAMMKVMPELTDEMKGFMSELRAVEADTHQHKDVENRE